MFEILEWSMEHRWVDHGSLRARFGSTFISTTHIGRDWMPQEDQSELGLMLETAGRLLAGGDREGGSRAGARV